MRPRKFDRDTADRLLRIFAGIKASEGPKYHEDGYCFNQFDAASFLIAMAWRGWEEIPNGIASNYGEIAKLATEWGLEFEDAVQISRLLISLSPAALVQQLKRWRTRNAVSALTP